LHWEPTHPTIHHLYSAEPTVEPAVELTVKPTAGPAVEPTVTPHEPTQPTYRKFCRCALVLLEEVYQNGALGMLPRKDAELTALAHHLVERGDVGVEKGGLSNRGRDEASEVMRFEREVMRFELRG
jgi:hypothetical protein